MMYAEAPADILYTYSTPYPVVFGGNVRPRTQSPAPERLGCQPIRMPLSQFSPPGLSRRFGLHPLRH
jgi:hypothetical protein